MPSVCTTWYTFVKAVPSNRFGHLMPRSALTEEVVNKDIQPLYDKSNYLEADKITAWMKPSENYNRQHIFCPERNPKCWMHDMEQFD